MVLTLWGKICIYDNYCIIKTVTHGNLDTHQEALNLKAQISLPLASNMPSPRRCHTLILMDGRKHLCHVDAIAWV